MEEFNTDQLQLITLDERETGSIRGGRSVRRMLFTFAVFMVCPALGMFHLGVREGYREAAAGM